MTNTEAAGDSPRRPQLPAVLQSEHPLAATSLTLMLLRGWSVLRVYQALLDRYPTAAALDDLFTSPTYLELVDEVAITFQDIRLAVEHLGDLADPEAIQQAVESHYPRALAAAEDFAMLLGVTPEDLLSVLLLG